jgi:hypothetical protein
MLSERRRHALTGRQAHFRSVIGLWVGHTRTHQRCENKCQLVATELRWEDRTGHKGRSGQKGNALIRIKKEINICNSTYYSVKTELSFGIIRGKSWYMYAWQELHYKFDYRLDKGVWWLDRIWYIYLSCGFQPHRPAVLTLTVTRYEY